MSPGARSVARAAARVVAALALLVAFDAARRTAWESVSTIWFARGEWDEPLEEAQDRLFGAEPMAAVRDLRARLPLDRTVFFVDEQPSPRGADYFALYFFAPRRLVRLGSADVPARDLRFRLEPEAEWVVRVPELGRPLRLQPAVELRRKRPGADQDRP